MNIVTPHVIRGRGVSSTRDVLLQLQNTHSNRSAAIQARFTCAAYFQYRAYSLVKLPGRAGVLPARCDPSTRVGQVHLNRRARAVGNKKPRRTRGAWEDSSAFADCRRNPCARYRFCPNTASNVLNLYTVFHYCRHEPTWRLRDSNP
jgi:hypothetical protein